MAWFAVGWPSQCYGESVHPDAHELDDFCVSVRAPLRANESGGVNEYPSNGAVAARRW
jgi:hypothetical protein